MPVAEAGAGRATPGIAARLLWGPTLACLVLALLIDAFDLDRAVVDRWYDPVRHVFPANHVRFWEHVAHDGGDRLVISVGLGALALTVTGSVVGRLRPLQRDAVLVLACVVSGPVLVALAKEATNVDCPFALERYGGTRPYVGLLEDRPDELPRGACFPAAHSSGAFTFFGFYFAWRHRHRRRARIALVATLALGVFFALTQWARGSHFPSHDLWSAWLVWMTCLGWWRALRPRGD